MRLEQTCFVLVRKKVVPTRLWTKSKISSSHTKNYRRAGKLTFCQLDVSTHWPDRHVLEPLLVGLDEVDEPGHVLAEQEQLVVTPRDK